MFRPVDTHRVLPGEDVLLVFDLVGVFRNPTTGGEREATDCEVGRAVGLVYQDALFDAVGGVDRLVLDVVGPSNQRFRVSVCHTRPVRRRSTYVRWARTGHTR